MKFFNSIVILCFIAVASCASDFQNYRSARFQDYSRLFTHPNKGPENLEQDLYDCETIAAQKSISPMGKGPFDSLSGFSDMIIADKEIQDCLRIKHGWKKKSNDMSERR
jgi:hypothetical protein